LLDLVLLNLVLLNLVLHAAPAWRVDRSLRINFASVLSRRHLGLVFGPFDTVWPKQRHDKTAVAAMWLDGLRLPACGPGIITKD